MADFSKKKGIDLIICDHHIPGVSFPKPMPFLILKERTVYILSKNSVVVGSDSVLQGFCLQRRLDNEFLYKFLDLVAVSIASDIVPIVGENRILAYFGMKNRQSAPKKSQGVDRDFRDKSPISISDVFYIGPRINGRLKHANEC